MNQDHSGTPALTGCLSQIGLVVVVTGFTLLLCALAMLMPPWVKVKCQRQQVLYWSESVEDYEVTFAGFHGLLAGKAWQTDVIGPSTPLSSGQLFDATEYRIFWRLLIGEWVVVAVIGGSFFLVVSWRLHVRPKAPDAKAKSD